MENNKYRFETKPLEPLILADKIEYAMNNYSEIFKKAENAYRKIKNNYVLDISVNDLLEIIK